MSPSDEAEETAASRGDSRYEGNAKVRSEPFEAVEVDLGLIWTRGGPTTWDFVAEETAFYGDAPAAP